VAEGFLKADVAPLAKIPLPGSGLPVDPEKVKPTANSQFVVLLVKLAGRRFQ